jgi:hypothetical protein
MKFTLTLRCDNAAFHNDDRGDHPSPEAAGREIARILRSAAVDVRDRAEAGDRGTLQDANGNTVGSWRIE